MHSATAEDLALHDCRFENCEMAPSASIKMYSPHLTALYTGPGRGSPPCGGLGLA